MIGTLAVLVLSVGMGQFAETIDMPEIHSISEMILTQVHRIYPPAALFFQGIAREMRQPWQLFWRGPCYGFISL
ncbi:hypothetical protein LC724_12300 [Blautia sp. RD014234]|nr:hypothetical protein [Blautia parvula]